MTQFKGFFTNRNKFIFKTFSCLVLQLVLFGLIQSCGPRLPESALVNPALNVPVATKQSQDAGPVNYELIPTYRPELRPKNTNLRYEKPIAEIKTAQAIIHLNQVKMSQVVMTFDAVTNKVNVKGQVEIIGNNEKVLAENSFMLSGIHQPSESSFRLTSDLTQKFSSGTKPTLGAQATCLAVTESEQPDCSSIVIDFFIAFQQKIYSEQMEIKRDLPQANTQPVAPAVKSQKQPETTTPLPEITTEPKESDLQIEGVEESVPGRLEGRAEVVDLTQYFQPDDQIQTTLKLKSVTASESNATPPVSGAKPSATPIADQIPSTLKKEANPKKETAPTAPVKTKEKESAAIPNNSRVTDDASLTSTGLIRPMNQAIGFPNKGTLRNATSLLSKQMLLDKKSFFEIVFPQRARYFGTYEMSEMLNRMGKYLNSSFNKKLAVSDISKASGGFLGPHLSHQIGMDADLGYPSTHDSVKIPVVVDMKNRKYNPESYSVAKTYELFKFAFLQQDLKIDRIFVDRTIKKALCEHAKAIGELNGENRSQIQELFKIMEHIDGHGDHFHLRLKCTSAHPACRHITYIENKGCD